MFLTPEEIYTLTKRRRRDAQMRVLRQQGLDFIEDGDGKPLVLKSAVERRGGGTATPPKSQEPNFKAIHGTQA